MITVTAVTVLVKAKLKMMLQPMLHPTMVFNIPCGYAIVCPQILQAMISDRAICKVCHGSLHLKEKYSACQSLDRVWTVPL